MPKKNNKTNRRKRVRQRSPKVIRINVKPTKRSRNRRHRSTGVRGGVAQQSPGTHYIGCALMPFVHRSPSFYPDGCGLPTVRLENRTVVTYNPQSTTAATLMVLPTLGRNLYDCRALGVLDDGTYNLASYAAAKTDLSAVAQAFRTVSLAVNVIPLDSPANRGGVAFIGRLRTETFPDGASTAYTVLPTTTALGTRYSTYWMSGVSSIANNVLLASPDSFSTELTRPFWARAVIKDAAHTFKPLKDAYFTLGTPDSSGVGGVATQPMDASAANVLTSANKVAGFDHNVTPIVVRFEGYPASSKFLIEVVHCVELVPALTSDWSYLSSPAPPRDQRALDLVSRVNRETQAGFGYNSIQEMMTSALPGVMRMMNIGMGVGAHVLSNRMIRQPNTIALN